MNGRGRRRRRKSSDGFIPPAMMVLMFFVAVFAILLMVVAVMRGREDRTRKPEAPTPESAVEEIVGNREIPEETVAE